MFILGLAIFEFSMQIIVGQLEAKGDYGSPVYTFFVGIATAGLTISISSILKLVIIAEEQVKANQESCDG